jgi:hypothetical protein
MHSCTCTIVVHGVCMPACPRTHFCFACTHSCVCTQANWCLQATTDYYYYVLHAFMKYTRMGAYAVFAPPSVLSGSETHRSAGRRARLQPCPLVHVYVVFVCVVCVHVCVQILSNTSNACMGFCTSMIFLCAQFCVQFTLEQFYFRARS